MKNVVLPVIATVITLFRCGCTLGSLRLNEARGHAVTLTETDSGKTVRIWKDACVIVSLPGNSSTGFSWDVESSSILRQQGEPDVVPNSGAVGAGATYRYFFEPVMPGTGTLKMVYRRPWETGAAPLRSFEISIVVGKD